MKVVIDSAIPFIQGVFEPDSETVYLPGEDIGPDVVRDADALIIRSRTRCDSELLEDSSVRVISTAAIGMDNIDLPYCSRRGIAVRNASGCNAGGVMNYVFSALYGVASRKHIKLEGTTMGIIGAGNTGHRIEKAARALGFNVLLCDPPRQAAEGPEGFCSLDWLLENSNVVTCHVPLNDSTRGMADDSFFEKMRPGAIFINSSRGEIVSDRALKGAIMKLGPVIIDTWNNEPAVDKELVNMADIATPHIAGYSYQGKLNGTASAVRGAARVLGISRLYDFFPESEIPSLNAVRLDVHGKSQGEVASLIQYNYPIFTDDFMFRLNPDDFVGIRSNYSYRREFYLD